MKLKHAKKSISALCLAVVCSVGLVGCGNSNGLTGGTAATVNGVEIPEDTITTYIQDFRTSSDLTEEAKWGEWLSTNSMDPSSVRQQVIDYYTEQEVIKQAAKENDINIDSSAIDEQVEKMKSNYDGDDAWQQALKDAGTTEDQYRESVELGLMEQELQSKVVTDVAEVTDAEVLEQLKTYSTMFDGSKRSSHILFQSGDQETAQKVLDEINAGTTDFAAAASQYSTDTASASAGGDVGWDTLNSFVTEYTTALTDLQKDQVSGLVTSQFGIHIIKCTDVFTAPAEVTALDQFPQEFVEYMRSAIASQNKTSSFSTWYEEYKGKADIQTNDMPENVPYNVDMSKYPSETDATTTDATTTDGTTTEATTEGTTEADAATTTDTTTATTDSGEAQNAA